MKTCTPIGHFSLKSSIDEKKEGSEAVTEKGTSGTDDKNEISMAGGGNTVKGAC